MTNSSPDYRSTVRETLSRMSDEALRFQDARVAGGIDREEIDREVARRAAGATYVEASDAWTDAMALDHPEARAVAEADARARAEGAS